MASEMDAWYRYFFVPISLGPAASPFRSLGSGSRRYGVSLLVLQFPLIILLRLLQLLTLPLLMQLILQMVQQLAACCSQQEAPLPLLQFLLLLLLLGCTYSRGLTFVFDALPQHSGTFHDVIRSFLTEGWKMRSTGNTATAAVAAVVSSSGTAPPAQEC